MILTGSKIREEIGAGNILSSHLMSRNLALIPTIYAWVIST